MKAQLLSVDGKKGKEISLPKVFSKKIREDILKKAFEAERFWQPYSHDPMGGKKNSASGTISHKRHDWKGHYGRGISRVPRKTMWRRGTQFYWVGAEISSTRGGRRAHGPKGNIPIKKINKKEYEIAFASAIASTANDKFILERYARVEDVKADLPFVMESKISSAKTKDLIEGVEKVLGKLKVVAKREKSIRAGRGKLRNRKYKKSAGLLIVTGDDEELKSNVFEQIKMKELIVSDLYPAGRVVIYTENAIKNLEELEK
jgi:large subunit ribosomal protein L4e